MNAEAPHPTDWYLDHLLADAERLAVVLETAATDAPIAACPGWDVLRLAEHLGQIHRWATFCIVNVRPPTATDDPIESFDRDDPAAWMRSGAARLADALRDLDPTAPTWHPFPVELVAAVWPRRQAHETAVHRWDGEQAVGAEATLDGELASDGIDEYFEIAVPRLIAREQLVPPQGSLHVHCTDVDGEWLVWSDAGEFRMVRAHQKGDAALRGPAAALLLRLWGRTTDVSDDVSIIGDEDVVDAWLSIAGM